MIQIKLMNGDLLSLDNREMTTQQLHDAVWDALPADIQPPATEKWRIMLFLDGVWHPADHSPVPAGAEADLVYDLLLVHGHWAIDLPLEDMIGTIWSTVIIVEGPQGRMEHRHFFDEDAGLFYRNEDVEHVNGRLEIREGAQPVTGRDLLSVFDVPLAVLEVFYAHWFECYVDILAPGCPRPLPYYCHYDMTDDDGQLLIHNIQPGLRHPPPLDYDAAADAAEAWMDQEHDDDYLPLGHY